MPGPQSILTHSLDAIPVLDPAATGGARDSAPSIPQQGGVIQRAILSPGTGEPYSSLRSLQSATWYRNLGAKEKKIATSLYNDTRKYTGKEHVTKDEALEVIRRESQPKSNSNSGNDRSQQTGGRTIFNVLPVPDPDSVDEQPKKRRKLDQKKKPKKKESKSSLKELKKQGNRSSQPIVIDSDDEKGEPLTSGIYVSDDEQSTDRHAWNDFEEDEDDEKREVKEEKEEKKKKKETKDRKLPAWFHDDDEEEDDTRTRNNASSTKEADDDDFEIVIPYDDDEDPLLDPSLVGGQSDSAEGSEDSEQSDSVEESSDDSSQEKKKRKRDSGRRGSTLGKKITKRKHAKSRVRRSGRSSEANLKLGRFARKTLSHKVGGGKTTKSTRSYSVAFVTFHIKTAQGNEVELPLEEKGKSLSFINLKSVETLPKGKLSTIRRRTSIRGVTDTGSGGKRWRSHLDLKGEITNKNAHAEVAISEYLLQHKDRIIEEIQGKIEKGQTLQSVTLRVDIDKPPCTGCTNKLSIAHDELTSILGVPVHFSVVYPEKKSNEGIRRKYIAVRKGEETDEDSASDNDIKEESSIPVRYSSDEQVSDDSSDEETKPLVKKAPEKKLRKKVVREKKGKKKEKEKSVTSNTTSTKTKKRKRSNSKEK